MNEFLALPVEGDVGDIDRQHGWCLELQTGLGPRLNDSENL